MAVDMDTTVLDKEIEGDPLWTVKRVAEYMDVSVRQVRRFYEDQGLKVVSFGPKLLRIRKSDVEDFIAAHHGPWSKLAS